MNIDLNNIPKHVAIIMDGNGRWAQNHAKERLYGHSSGVESVRQVVRAASEIGVEFLTIYAFSTENWGRPKNEVDGLMQLLAVTIANEMQALAEQGVRIKFIGDIEALPIELKNQTQKAANIKIDKLKLTLIVALNYSAREEIVAATKKIARKIVGKTLEINQIDEKIIENNLYTAGVPDPELLIRTSGEMRLSNFLLWQVSYAEFIFTDVLWPDFDENEFLNCIKMYQNRARRFGKI